ncbi:MAG: hypothetical protein ACI4BD_01025 [Paludibacteraceae bacterium]
MGRQKPVRAKGKQRYLYRALQCTGRRPYNDKNNGNEVRQMSRRHVLYSILYACIATLIIAIVGKQTGLFWDNILFANLMSAPLIENGVCAWGSIPLHVDPGHPPLLATYLTLIWSIFGRSLAITHLAMLPFIFVFIFGCLHICYAIFGDVKWSYFAVFLVLADPTIFANLVYIGCENLILCFSMIAILGIVLNNPILKSIGLMLLGISTLRGMLLCAGIFLWDYSRCTIRSKQQSLLSFFTLANCVPYVIGAIPALIFLGWRLLNKGWIIGNPLQPWGDAWGYSDLSDFLFNFFRNCVVLIHRFIDFGRVLPILFILFFLYTYRKLLQKDKQLLSLVLFCVLPCSLIGIISLVICNPMGHCYYLLSYMGIEILFVYLLKQYVPASKHLICYLLCLSALVMGNFIVYPEKISQGWNSSLASLPFWEVRQQTLNYIEEKEIYPEQILTYFPFGRCADDIDLSGDTRMYASNASEAKYIMASNVCNLDDDTIDLLHTYTPIAHFEKRRVHITLYQLP